jgi:hypothetical protein
MRVGEKPDKYTQQADKELNADVFVNRYPVETGGRDVTVKFDLSGYPIVRDSRGRLLAVRFCGDHWEPC